ncbi:MAG: DUF2752 domain-containing protein, partial [Acidobacteria bacterium]|nr:DUF2752 domain-containing protein [Acidobacteriota bacterium]
GQKNVRQKNGVPYFSVLHFSVRLVSVAETMIEAQFLIMQDRPQDFENWRLGFTSQDRIRYLVVAGSSTALLLIARLLRPSVDGVGTHRQLWLPPCAFLHFTGIPCPSCGLTTSVAHAARLHFYESVITQPFGLVVFISAVLGIPLSIYFIYRRVPWSKLNRLRGRNLVIYLMIALFILSWLYKIAAMKGLFAHG